MLKTGNQFLVLFVNIFLNSNSKNFCNLPSGIVAHAQTLHGPLVIYINIFFVTANVFKHWIRDTTNIKSKLVPKDNLPAKITYQRHFF